MFSIMNLLIRQFRNWDIYSKVAFILALILFFVIGFVGFTLPPDQRGNALIGLAGVLIVMQAIFLWANRGMVTPFTKAQRHYLAGEFEAARDILEALRSAGDADMRALTLLGNTYRQLGDLSASHAVLEESLAIAPNHHFPRYGFGRTLLVSGQYAEAVDYFMGALETGAPPTVQIDLAEARYRSGERGGAVVRPLHQARDAAESEPHRALMAAYLLYRLDVEAAPAPDLIEAGIAYWRAEAERFEHTAYGIALSNDLNRLEAFTREG